MKKFWTLFALFAIAVMIGYAIGRVHNLELAGGGLMKYCIELEFDHHLFKEGWIEAERAKEWLQFDLDVCQQQRLGCEEQFDVCVEEFNKKEECE